MPRLVAIVDYPCRVTYSLLKDSGTDAQETSNQLAEVLIEDQLQSQLMVSQERELNKSNS